MANLVDIVIFRGHPENGDGGNASGDKFMSALNGAEGFVEGVRWATKQAHLLAGDHSDSAFCQEVQILQSFRTATVEHILITQNAGNLNAALLGKLQLPDAAGRGFQLRNVLVKRFDLGEILDVITKEFR